MSFQPGNQFWLARSSHGRKPAFETAEDLWDACLQYFQWVEENPLQEEKVFHSQGEITKTTINKMRAMTLDGLLLFIGITDQTWYNYEDRGDDFLEVIETVEKVIRSQKFAGAAADLLNANIIARDLGLKDSKEHSVDEGLLKVIISSKDAEV